VPRRFGMTHCVNPVEAHRDIVQHLVTLTDGAPTAPSTAPATHRVRHALEACHRGWGVSVVIGWSEAGTEISTRPFQLVTRVGSGRARIRGRPAAGPTWPKCVDCYHERQDRDRSDYHPLLKLEDINKGFDLMHEGKSNRSVVVF